LIGLIWAWEMFRATDIEGYACGALAQRRAHQPFSAAA